MKLLLPIGTVVLSLVPFLVGVRAEIAEHEVERHCRSVQEVICNTNSFQNFCDALDYSGLDEKLDRDTPHYTVFVPSNSAWREFYNECDVDDFEDFSLNTLKDLLLYHIHQDDIIDRDDLEDRCGELLEMKNGGDTRTKCEEDDSNNIYQKGDRNPEDDKPRIISFDIDACNGIVHVLNRVMLPSHFRCGPNNPTRRPTPRPTRDNDPHPTRKPTRNPTKKPTRSPSHPTKKPTRKPTRYPTREPWRNPTRKPTRRPTPRPTGTINDAACSAHPRCRARGLTGDCCPTGDDVDLDCCSNNNPTRRPTPRPTGDNDEASCSAHPRCHRLELAGLCCPTSDDVTLACCSNYGDDDDDDDDHSSDCDDDHPDRAECSAHPVCRDLGLGGDCCPTNDDERLDCCSD